MAQAGISVGGFLARWLAAFVLVFITFNPTSYSYTNWLIADRTGDDLPIKALAGVLLLIAYVIFLRATWRSIGLLGLILIALLFGAIGWVLIDYDLLDPGQATLFVQSRIRDFNDRRGSRTLALFQRIADESRKHPGQGPTFPADDPSVEIDHIFFGPPGAWEFSPTEVIDERAASDHRPLVARGRLRD